MSVVRIQLKSKWNLKEVENNPDKWEILREYFPELPETFGYYDDIEKVINVDDLAELPEVVLENIEIKPIKKLQLTKLKKDLNHHSLGTAEVIQEVKQTVQVHLPGHELISIKQVDWLEDSCTETLQEKLDKGWKILAVCPQTARRRPDYIIGRVDRI